MKLIEIFIILLIVLAAIVNKSYEGFMGEELYMAGPTKCFSCERDLINRYGYKYAYLGKPTKCFSCEKQLHNTLGPNYANLAQPTRCFSCEQDLLNR
tara:strand:+ start:49 stop:339 length:291 start_codon:yes stop_codon:yes gene_type:complete